MSNTPTEMQVRQFLAGDFLDTIGAMRWLTNKVPGIVATLRSEDTAADHLFTVALELCDWMDSYEEQVRERYGL